MPDYQFECTFCGQKFVREDRFLKHKCKQMIRDEQFRSVVGQAAWGFYQEWMRAQRKIVPKSSAFLHSKFFTSFYKFAEFVRRVKLPDNNLFIKLMVTKRIMPTIWTRDEVYAKYLEHYDYRVEPKKHASDTIKMIIKIAEAAECNENEIFDILTPNDVIQLIRERRFSPWFLINSPKFLKFFTENTTSEEQMILQTIIRADYWKKKFIEHEEDLKVIKTLVRKLNL